MSIRRSFIVALLVVARSHCGSAFQVNGAITSLTSRVSLLGHHVKSLSSETSTRLFVTRNESMDQKHVYFMDEKEPPKEPLPVVTAGNSPKAIKLRKQLQEVWTSPRTSPILVIGPSGSGKGTIVEELLEGMPASQKVAVHRLSMDDATNYCETMLGSDSQPGLLDILAGQKNSTLVLNSFQSRSVKSAEELGRRKELFEAIAKLISQRSFFSRFEDKEKPFAPRIIATCSHRPDFADDSADIFLVNVPPLESRTKDMEAIATSKIKLLENKYGLHDVNLSPQATHRLLDHRWEVCESELDEELSSALELLASEKQRDPELQNTLKSKHMFVNIFDESMRHRLLYEFPILRKIIHSPWIFDHTLRYIVTPAFILVLAILFLGPQTRDHNTALTIFWAGWYVV